MIRDQMHVEEPIISQLVERKGTELAFSKTNPFAVVTTIINPELCLLIKIGSTTTMLRVTGMALLWKGIKDGPSSILGQNPMTGCHVNPCAVVVFKQAMEGILLDQLIGKNHLAKLVFLAHGKLQEPTTIANFRIDLFILSFRTKGLSKKGLVHMELQILNLVGPMDTGNSIVLSDERHMVELVVEAEEELPATGEEIREDGMNGLFTVGQNLTVRCRTAVLKLHPTNC
jgi:hypothetical protein